MKKPGFAVLFFSLFVVFVVLLTPRILQIRRLEARSQNLETDLKRAQFENKALENELRLLREDPVYLEKVAREKFNKAKQGEIVYRVIRDAPQSGTQ